MALILYDKEFVFEETIVLKDKQTKESKFEFDCKITEEEAQTIKEFFRSKEELTEAQEKQLYGILFKDSYNKVLEEIGEFKLEEFGLMLVSSLLGKLGNERLNHMTYATSKYQKTIKK